MPAPIARTVVVGNDNVRLNFDEDPNGATCWPRRHRAPSSGQLGTFTAIAAGDTAASYSARIDWGDGNASFATLTPNPDGTFSVAGLEHYASPGVYAVRVLVTHLSDGQTIALNATVAVDSSTYSGPTFPNPAYPGQGGATQGSSGRATPGRRAPGPGTTTGSGHGRITRRSITKPAHPSQAGIRALRGQAPAQGPAGPGRAEAGTRE